ncbi:MAG: hypothetical protein R2695_19140 [Acidimicrobiales bacterium]
MYRHLLSPVSIGAMTLRNRMVMAPMGVEIVGNDEGQRRDRPLLRGTACGGAGLIITEVCAMAYPRGANSVHQLGLSDDSFVEPLRVLTDRVHGPRREDRGAAGAPRQVLARRHQGGTRRAECRPCRPGTGRST